MATSTCSNSKVAELESVGEAAPRNAPPPRDASHPMLRHCLRVTHLDGEWPDQYAKATGPFSLSDSDLLFGKERKGRRKIEGLLALDPLPKFDLVIVDEAHHICNPETYLHQAVRYFCDNAQAAVFLTATPVQPGSQDLFVLLNVLRPDRVIDRASIEQMATPNRSVNAAVGHCRAARDSWQDEVRACMDEAVFPPTRPIHSIGYGVSVCRNWPFNRMGPGSTDSGPSGCPGSAGCSRRGR